MNRLGLTQTLARKKWSGQDDCDFLQEKIIVRPKPEHGNPLKKDAGREIEMHARVKELLLAWREEWTALFNGEPPCHQWVFVHPANPKIRSQGFRTAFRHASAKAGLPGLRPYDLRHLFCSFALMNGIDRNVVREWMGHKSFQMIDLVYSHSLADYRRQQMAKMQIALPVAVEVSNQIPAPESAANS